MHAKVHFKNEEVMKHHLKQEEIRENVKEIQHEMSTCGFVAILIAIPCLELIIKKLQCKVFHNLVFISLLSQDLEKNSANTQEQPMLPQGCKTAERKRRMMS